MASLQAAMQRRLGMNDARGPQGMFSRGSNVYRGGLPNAQAGGGNPNIGRPSAAGQPSMAPVATGMETPSPTMTTLVGSLPPGAGNANSGVNDAVMQLIRNRFMRTAGQGVSGG